MTSSTVELRVKLPRAGADPACDSQAHVTEKQYSAARKGSSGKRPQLSGRVNREENAMTKTEELVESLTELMRAVLNAEQAPESPSERRQLAQAELATEAALNAVMLRAPLDTVPDEELLTELKARMDRGLNLRPWLDAVEKLEG